MNIGIIIISVILCVVCLVNYYSYVNLYTKYVECKDKFVDKEIYNFIRIFNFIIGLLSVPSAIYLSYK